LINYWGSKLRIGVACDHAGYELKQAIMEHLEGKEHQVVDFGTDRLDSCDYPDFIPPVAEGVQSGELQRGILICGTGLGMSIGANRYKGVRAVLVFDLFSAEMTRRHNDANILVLAGMITAPPLAKRIVDVWLNTEFEGGRHQRRIEKLDHLG